MPQVEFLASPGRILRVLTDFGVLLVKGDSWDYVGESLAIIDAEAKTVAEFRQELIQGVIVEENFFGEEESCSEQDQTQA